ncbi:MAG: DNA mismatch repair endonuclease MutL [Parachlamydiaceae bacterium]|nr:DNA mismatch repair endonuclease MutL [Parachlamydiaceae bacterium]
MSKIRVLDDHTINKIAAGEVIENPSSVVKELVENAMDAGATEITIEIMGGGRQLIRITDNGCGMSQDDALLCLERHATSKIRQVDDIHEIMTMGFRGEAIPSIASISKFTLLTTPNTSEKNNNGTMIIVDGGKLLTATPAARSPGTTIEVKSLFFNVPVRKKFQKSPTYDAQEILKIITIISLGYPNIKFELISDQNQILNTSSLPPDHTFQENLGFRIETVFGKDFFEGLCPVSAQEDEFQLEGFIGLPEFTRHNRTGQYLFINQRAVHSPIIGFAVRDGYGTMLPTNRHPIFVLHLRIPGSLIDVNVHPQKKEVRLRQESHLKALITKAIQKALQGNNFSFNFEPNHFNANQYSEIISDSTPTNLWQQPTPSFEYNFNAPNDFNQPSIEKENNEIPFERQNKPTIDPKQTNIPIRTYQPLQEPQDLLQKQFDFKPTPTPPRILSTLQGYILLDPDSLNSNFLASQPSSKKQGLCLINQKAAFARIFYERLMKQEQPNDQKGKSYQTLLIPYTLEFSTIEASLLIEHLTELNDMGFGIQEFGENTFIVNSIPSMIKQEELKPFIISIVQDLKELQDTRRVHREKEKSIAQAACRHTPAANRRLSFEEANALLAQLMECQSPFQCPLGRPTFLQVSLEDLSRQFQLSDNP